MHCIGSISESRVETQFEWAVPNFFSLPTDPDWGFKSPMFNLSDCSWHLTVYPNGYKNPEWISLFLTKEDIGPDTKTINFTLGVKKADGTLEQKGLDNIAFTKDTPICGFPSFYKRNDILLRKAHLAPLNTLTLTCSMKDHVEVPTKLVKLMELESLSADFRDLFISKSNFDVTVKVKQKRFHVHRAILVARSSVFSAVFEHDMLEKETGVITIEDCDPHSFGDFLQYLYTGRAEDVTFRIAYNLFITADKYDVKELKSFCIAYMMENLTVENVCDVITLADEYEESELLSSAQVFFNRNVNEILPTAEWETLLKDNHRLANKFFKGMASKVKIIEEKVADTAVVDGQINFCQ